MLMRSAGLVLLILFSAAGVAERKAGDMAPRFTAKTLAGNTVTFPESSGQPRIVLMWATWCPYCSAVMPYLQNIQNELGVTVVAINAKERGRGDPAAYMQAKGYTFQTVLRGDAIAALWDVEFLPGLFVVDGTGRIVFRRGWTELPAGKTVAQLWDRQVRQALDRL